MESNNTYRPLFGMFYLSREERIVFSIMTIFLGAIICSYKNQELFRMISENKDPHETISSWYTLPFLLMCYWLLDPILEPKWLTSMKIKAFTERKGYFKPFFIDCILSIIFLFLSSIIYSLSTYILFLILWL